LSKLPGFLFPPENTAQDPSEPKNLKERRSDGGKEGGKEGVIQAILGIGHLCRWSETNKIERRLLGELAELFQERNISLKRFLSIFLVAS
jgi:hypothetical protein